MLLTLSIDFFAYDFPMARLAQTNKPIATKNTKKASSHTDVSLALISAANRFPAKYDFAGREIAAPMGALLMTESTQRPFCVFCGNWIVGLSLFLWLRLCRAGNNRGWRRIAPKPTDVTSTTHVSERGGQSLRDSRFAPFRDVVVICSCRGLRRVAPHPRLFTLNRFAALPPESFAAPAITATTLPDTHTNQAYTRNP
jgi:hypothetical protein